MIVRVTATRFLEELQKASAWKLEENLEHEQVLEVFNFEKGEAVQTTFISPNPLDMESKEYWRFLRDLREMIAIKGPQDLGDGKNPEWRTENPPTHGYYLGAWKLRGKYRVSELWYMPDTIGGSWYTGRGYLIGRDGEGRKVDVLAWMPLPEYKSGG